MQYINKYVIIAGFFIMIWSWCLGNYYGQQSMKNSIENKQKTTIIANQQSVIRKMQTAQQITDMIVTQQQESNHQLQIQLSESIKNAENIKLQLDSTNVIRGNLLRYINSSNYTMPTIPRASNRINDDSDKYSATEFGTAVKTLIYTCQVQRNNYIALQAWINQQKEVFDK
jgi:hypothetical protein